MPRCDWLTLLNVTKLLEQLDEEHRTVAWECHLVNCGTPSVPLAHPNLQYLICHGEINTINELLLFGVPVIGVHLQNRYMGIQLLHTLLKEVVLPPTMDNSEGFEFQLSLSANGLVGERIASRPNFSSEAAPSVVSRRMVELYKIQAIERRWSLQLILKRNPDFYHRLYNNLVPEAHCPELVRLGSTNDGGRWICSPFRIPRSCTVFSVGLVNEVTFERELQYVTDYQCRIFAYDAGTQKRSTLKILEGIHGKLRQTSVKDETDVSRNQYTLMDLMKLEGVFKVDVLKIVIEGSGFMAFLRHHKPVQILLEMHGTPLEALKQLNYISRHGYWLYSYEVNGYLHNRAWYSFIHEDAMQQYGVTKLAKILDFSL